MEYTEIDIEVSDITAKADGATSVSGSQSFSTIGDLDADETISMCQASTLEQDIWSLDGSKACFPGTTSNYKWGWWSAAQSGADGAFAAAQTLTRAFTANHTSLGITLIFGGDAWASAVNIKWYDSADTLLYSMDFAPDGLIYYCKNTVENYRKVVMSFTGMSKPYRYLKLLDVIWGERKVFAESDITAAVMLEEYDPISAEVKIGTLEFSIYSTDDDFSVMNPTGAYKALQQRQPIKTFKIADGVKKKVGVHYLDEWKNSSENVSDMKAVDAIGVLDGVPWKRKFYTGAAAAAVAADIQALSGVTINLGSAFSASTVTGMIDDGTCRNAVQQLAFAIGAAACCRKSAEVYLETPPTALSGSIQKERQITPQEVSLRALVTGVEVTSHSYDSGGNDTTAVTGYYMSSLPANAAKNVLQISEATLISPDIAAATAQRVYEYYQLRHRQEGDMIWDTEESGDKLTIPSQNATAIQGRLESMETDLINGGVGNGVIIGSVAT